jgi:hypothetical protein
MGLDMPQPPETYHTSPALYTDLDIPTDVSGTLPTAVRTRAGLSAEVEEDLGGTRRTRDGGRGRGGRSGPRGGAPAESAPSAEGGDRPQRQRRRRKVAEGTDTGAAGRGTDAPADVPAAAGPGGGTEVTRSSDDPGRPRRRRRRGGRTGRDGESAPASEPSAPSEA